MALKDQINALATRVGQEFVAVRDELSNVSGSAVTIVPFEYRGYKAAVSRQWGNDPSTNNLIIYRATQNATVSDIYNGDTGSEGLTVENITGSDRIALVTVWGYSSGAAFSTAELAVFAKKFIDEVFWFNDAETADIQTARSQFYSTVSQMAAALPAGSLYNGFEFWQNNVLGNWPDGSINDGGADQYDNGNFILTSAIADLSQVTDNPASYVPYAGGVAQTNATEFGAGSSYFTGYEEGYSIFAMVAFDASVDGVAFRGNSGSDGNGQRIIGALSEETIFDATQYYKKEESDVITGALDTRVTTLETSGGGGGGVGNSVEYLDVTGTFWIEETSFTQTSGGTESDYLNDNVVLTRSNTLNLKPLLNTAAFDGDSSNYWQVPTSTEWYVGPAYSVDVLDNAAWGDYFSVILRGIRNPVGTDVYMRDTVGGDIYKFVWTSYDEASNAHAYTRYRLDRTAQYGVSFPDGTTLNTGDLGNVSIDASLGGDVSSDTRLQIPLMLGNGRTLTTKYDLEWNASTNEYIMSKNFRVMDITNFDVSSYFGTEARIFSTIFNYGGSPSAVMNNAQRHDYISLTVNSDIEPIEFPVYTRQDGYAKTKWLRINYTGGSYSFGPSVIPINTLPTPVIGTEYFYEVVIYNHLSEEAVYIRYIGEYND